MRGAKSWTANLSIQLTAFRAAAHAIVSPLFVARLHDQVSMILALENYDRWLDPSARRQNARNRSCAHTLPRR